MSEFDFIFEEPAAKSANTGGPGTVQRILVVVFGLFFLLTGYILLQNTLLKPDTGPIDSLTTVYAIQSDIIELSKEAETSLRSNENRILAIGSRAVITSDQQAISGFLGENINQKIVSANVDSQIRTTLESAASANKYDEAFSAIYPGRLTDYRQALQTAFQLSPSESQRLAISKAYVNVSIILGLDRPEADQATAEAN